MCIYDIFNIIYISLLINTLFGDCIYSELAGFHSNLFDWLC